VVFVHFIFVVHGNFMLMINCLHCPVYSSWEVGKLQCFKWIKERYGGPNVRFCAVGDGHEERSAASIMKWPFVKIEIGPDAPHRFPGLSLSTIHGIMDAVYQPSSKDG
jgi:eyes absent family protein 1